MCSECFVPFEQGDVHLPVLTVYETLDFARDCQTGQRPPVFDLPGKLGQKRRQNGRDLSMVEMGESGGNEPKKGVQGVFSVEKGRRPEQRIYVRTTGEEISGQNSVAATDGTSDSMTNGKINCPHEKLDEVGTLAVYMLLLMSTVFVLCIKFYDL